MTVVQDANLNVPPAKKTPRIYSAVNPKFVLPAIAITIWGRKKMGIAQGSLSFLLLESSLRMHWGSHSSLSLSLENGLMQMSGGARPRGRAEKEEEAWTRRFPARGLLNSQISKADGPAPFESIYRDNRGNLPPPPPPPSGTFSGGERGMGVG